VNMTSNVSTMLNVVHLTETAATIITSLSITIVITARIRVVVVVGVLVMGWCKQGSIDRLWYDCNLQMCQGQTFGEPLKYRFMPFRGYLVSFHNNNNKNNNNNNNDNNSNN
jgi:hypothetical protein